MLLSSPIGLMPSDWYIQLPLAVAERVFSILQQFTAQQHAVIFGSDYLENSLLCYNIIIIKRNSQMGGRLSKIGEPEKQNR